MFTFSESMPDYLSENNFIEWHKKISHTLSLIGFLDSAPNNLHIEFSNDKKSKKYGSLSIKEIKNIIRETWRTDNRVEEILNQINSLEDYNKDQYSGILIERICYCNRDESPDYIFKKIKEMFDNCEFVVDVLGEYIHTHSTVVLYTKNIEKYCVGCNPVESFESVFSHEMLHAYHYKNNDDELLLRADYTSKVVKESLASAFEWFYCVENKIPHESHILSAWYHSIEHYPYSGAKNLIDYDLTARLKTADFYKIFKLSLLNMDDALRELLSKKEFYQIKNLIYIRKRTVYKDSTKPVAISTIKKLTREDLEIYFAGTKVGKIAQKTIPAIISKKPTLIPLLMDTGYCKKELDFDSYTILSLSREYISGGFRYYKNAVYNYCSKQYYLCNNWREFPHRKALLDWIWRNL